MIDKIINTIEQYHTIVIHRHVRPDPDALGSQGGLACFIKEAFPDKQVFVVGEETASLNFLLRMDQIPDDSYKDALVIVCDTANQARISDERYKLGKKLVKIDHHPNEDPYGDLLWVNPEASSVSEMIVSMYEHMDNLTIPDEAARLLYAGIVGDTGRFLFSNTTETTFNMAGKLIRKSFDRQELYNRLYEMPLELMRLNGYVLQNYEVNDAGIGYIKIPLEITNRFGVKPEETSLLVNSFADTLGIKAWVFFIEEHDQIRVRLRSKGPVVNTIASEFGGGGHPMAAGATIYHWDDTDKIMELLTNEANAFNPN